MNEEIINKKFKNKTVLAVDITLSDYFNKNVIILTKLVGNTRIEACVNFVYTGLFLLVVNYVGIEGFY